MDYEALKLKIKDWPKPYKWMVEDIIKGITLAEANYLVGLGLMVYTEVVGKKILEFQRSEIGSPKTRFLFFLKEYMGYDEEVKRYGEKMYNWYRNGLSHDYTIAGRKTGIHIRFSEKDKDKIERCGINTKRGLVIDEGEEMFFIVLEPYLFGFVDGIQKFLNEIYPQPK